MFEGRPLLVVGVAQVTCDHGRSLAANCGQCEWLEHWSDREAKWQRLECEADAQFDRENYRSYENDTE